MARHFEIDNEELTGRAFQARDLLPLLGHYTIGENLRLPGAVGRRAFAQVTDEIDVTIQWFLDGNYDETDTPAADPYAQFTENLEYYRALFMDSGDPTTGLVTAVLHLDVLWTAEIQVKSWSPVWEEAPAASVATRIVVPAGRWTTPP